MKLFILALCLLFGSFIFSTILTALVRRFSLKSGFVARPAADRYHQSVIPLGGGIAISWTIIIFLLAAAGIVKFLMVPGYLDFLGERITVHAKGFVDNIGSLMIVIGCVLVLHLVGLWDDKKSPGAMVKLFFQFAVAAAAAGFANIRVELFIENTLITTALSVFWIVLIMNSFNFLDNMDGLSAGIAVIAVSVLFFAAASSGQLFVGALSLIFIGALLGFLVFNFPPARIFMGDCGSLVIGFLVGLLTLRTTYYNEVQSGGAYAVFIPLVVMAVPLYDFISVTIIRLSQGRSPFVGDTQHFSHRMKRRGLTDTQTALTLYLATLCTGIGAIFLFQVNLAGAILVFLQTLMILFIIAIMEVTGKS